MAQPPAPVLTTLHAFDEANGDGGYPSGGLALGAGGVLYGTTVASSTNQFAGTVFSLTPPPDPGGAWTETVLYSYGNNPAGPLGGVAIGAGGVLYGTTGQVGGFGTVFSLTPPASAGGAWTLTVLYSFGGSAGAYPQACVVVGADGVLYGTASSGGATGAGTVFSLTPPASPGGPWTEQTIYSFAGGSDGYAPGAAVVIGAGGVLYSTTAKGGIGGDCPKGGCGTVFSLTPPSFPGGDWTEAILHTFTGSPDDGVLPRGGLAIGAGGVLYGVTSGGGSTNHGTAFSLTPPASAGGVWTEAVLYSFASTDKPLAGLTIGSGGMLYGTSTTFVRSDTGRGFVFRLKPPVSPGGDWTEETVYNFTHARNGASPQAPLLIGPDGLLYGTTNQGGLGYGTAFSLQP
jgi:uncharacterized repeat protein (TIGR03803 family)